MENRDQTPSSSSPENLSFRFPATLSPLNHHPPLPAFDKPRLNPNSETILAAYLDGLSLSEPSHDHSWDPHGSVISRRVQSAVNGQNFNPHVGVSPRPLGPGYVEDLGYRNLVNGRDGFLDNGQFGPDPMYGLSGPMLGSPNWPVQFGQNSSLYDGFSRRNHFNYGNVIDSENGSMNRPRSIFSGSDLDNGSFLSTMDSFGPILDRRNGPDGPVYSRPNFVQNGPMYDQNGFLNRPKPMYDKWVNGPSFSPGECFDPSLDPNWLFVPDSVYASNGLSKSLLSSRPNVGLNRPAQHKTWGDQSGLSQTGPVYSENPGNSSCWPEQVYSKYQIKEFKGNIKNMAKSRECSGLLKKKIEDGAEEDLELIFEEVKNDVASLMMNYSGSIVAQKLFKVCRPEQISQMLFSVTKIKVLFIDVCCDNHGSAAMGKLLENLTTCDQRTKITSDLSSVVLKLCKDQNGLKVVKYCIDHFPENVGVLINEIARDCLEIAMHKSGCCIFEPCLSRADGETLERFMDKLGPNAVALSVHQYGNYVVQSLLDKKNPSIAKNIIAQLVGHYVYISMDRCGSNVVEKCLLVASENEAIKIIIEIMNSEKFAMVLTDPYGNYVVQKALDVSLKIRWKEVRENLENGIMQLYASLHNHPYGNRVLSKIKNFAKRF